MKTSINKLCIAASILVTAAGISACVDDNKTLYDPEYKTPNPMEEISAPTGFDWSSTHSIKFNVEVNDVPLSYSAVPADVYYRYGRAYICHRILRP